MRIAFLIILGIILISNIFSAQFLLWIAPFIAFLSPLESGLAIFASLITLFYFRYWNDVIYLYPMAVNFLLLRNFLLIALFIVSLFFLTKDLKKTKK